jgi:hypothetical protein
MLRRVSIVTSLLFLIFSSVSPVNAVAPAAPENIVVKASTTQTYNNGTLEISWDAVSGAIAYGVRLKKQSDGITAASNTVDGEQNTKITFDKLEGGTTYVVQVNAVNALRELSPWSSASLTAVPKTAPQAPSKPTVVIDVRKATVSWVAVPTANNGGFDITSYVVKEINSGKSVSAAGSATSIEVTGLSNGADVEFTVSSVNAASATGTVSEKSLKYKLGDLPSTMLAPGLAATTTTTEARVNWQAPASDGGSSLLSFTVKLIKDGVDLLTQVVERISDTTYTFTALLAGTYEAKIYATNAVGDSVLSPVSGQLTLGATASASAVPTAAPSATPSATPSASAPPPTPSPTPTPTPTPSSTPAPPPPAPPSGGSSGGGFGGGFVPPAVVALGIPAPSPSATTTPSPSPTPSVSQLPIATASPTPTVTLTATASPKPSSTPTASPKPSPVTSASPSLSPASQLGVTKNAKGEVTKTTTFAIPVKVSGPVKSVTLTAAKATISTSLKNAVQPAIPSVKKGTAIKVVIRGADGKSYTVASTTAKSTGTYKTPAIKFSKPGTYLVTVTLGKVQKVITYKIGK